MGRRPSATAHYATICCSSDLRNADMKTWLEHAIGKLGKLGAYITSTLSLSFVTTSTTSIADFKQTLVDQRR